MSSKRIEKYAKISDLWYEFYLEQQNNPVYKDDLKELWLSSALALLIEMNAININEEYGELGLTIQGEMELDKLWQFLCSTTLNSTASNPMDFESVQQMLPIFT